MVFNTTMPFGMFEAVFLGVAEPFCMRSYGFSIGWWGLVVSIPKQDVSLFATEASQKMA